MWASFAINADEEAVDKIFNWESDSKIISSNY